MTNTSSFPPSQSSFNIHRFANPRTFLRFASKIQSWVTISAIIFLVIGVIWGLCFSPADWQQGDSVRIMYIHVPMAILASGGYFALAACALCSLIWKHPLADLAAGEIGPIGAVITALCLITGSLWGKPMWGTWWVWDARLTSVLVLFFLYLGHITLLHAFDNQQKGYKAAAILALVGVFDLPIIKFSVNWWHTLHQPSTFSIIHAPAMSLSMIWPLIFCFMGFALGFIALVCMQLRAAILERQVRHFLLNE